MTKYGVIINNNIFGKEYIIVEANKMLPEKLSPWTYKTIKAAKEDAKRLKIKLRKDW